MLPSQGQGLFPPFNFSLLHRPTSTRSDEDTFSSNIYSPTTFGKFVGICFSISVQNLKLSCFEKISRKNLVLVF